MSTTYVLCNYCGGTVIMGQVCTCMQMGPMEITQELIPDPTLPEQNKPVCYQCERELCNFLDAYYGDDLFLSNLCRECRGKQ